MKKIFICCFVFFVVFIIYIFTVDRKTYYLSLGDSSMYSYDFSGVKVFGYSYYVSNYLNNSGVLERYVSDFSRYDSRITDLINDISSNRKINNFTLKNSLIKADLVTFKIDGSDVYGRILLGKYNEVYDYIDDLCRDFDSLLKLMREYCKENIVFVGFINPFVKMNNSDIDDLINYMNRRYKEICDDYNVLFVNISNLDLSGEYNGIVYFNKYDYQKIAGEIIKII